MLRRLTSYFFLLFAFFLPFNLAALDFNEDGSGDQLDGEPLFISLGGLCTTALALRANGLRKAAFPFDWIVTTDHKYFIKIINEDFRFFIEKEVFNINESHEKNLCNTHYKAYFPHDSHSSIFEDQAQWDQFKEKYHRRITRFRQLRDYPGKVFFIRTFWVNPCEAQEGEFNENTQRAKELKTALDAYFPLLNFTLVILTYRDLNVPEMLPLEGVVEWRIERSHEAFGAIANAFLTP